MLAKCWWFVSMTKSWRKWQKISHSLCMKKLWNFCLKTKQEQQKYNSMDDNCYLKITCYTVDQISLSILNLPGNR